MNAKRLTDLADQLYDLSELIIDGEHNMKAAVAVGSFNVIALLEAIAAAVPEIVAVLKILVNESTDAPFA